MDIIEKSRYLHFQTGIQNYDFLVSYQSYLNSLGFIFEDKENQLNEIKNWVLSAKEFLH